MLSGRSRPTSRYITCDRTTLSDAYAATHPHTPSRIPWLFVTRPITYTPAAAGVIVVPAKAWPPSRNSFSAENAPALAVYRKFGFATAYTYHYRARPDECR